MPNVEKAGVGVVPSVSVSDVQVSVNPNVSAQPDISDAEITQPNVQLPNQTGQQETTAAQQKEPERQEPMQETAAPAAKQAEANAQQTAKGLNREEQEQPKQEQPKQEQQQQQQPTPATEVPSVGMDDIATKPMESEPVSNELQNIDWIDSSRARRQHYSAMGANGSEQDSVKSVVKRESTGLPSGIRSASDPTKHGRLPKEAAGANAEHKAWVDKIAENTFVQGVRKVAEKPINYVRSRMRTADSAEDLRKDEAKRIIGDKNGEGQAFYGKVVGDADMQINQVGVPIRFIKEVMDIPNNIFAQYILEQTGIDMYQDGAIDQLRNFCRTTGGIPVAVFKSPNLEPEQGALQRMVLVDGAVFQLHPLAAKKWNADFDGDDIDVSFKGEDISSATEGRRYYINLAREAIFDQAFFPRFWCQTDKIPEDIRETSLRFMKSELPEGNHRLAELVCDLYFANKKKEREAAMEDLCRFLKDKEAADLLLTKAYNAARLLATAHGGLGREATPKDVYMSKLPEPATQNDRKIYRYIDDVFTATAARGAKNFQDYAAFVHDYLGEPKGTNPKFRLTANVAKMFVNIDERVAIGSEYDVSAKEIWQSMFSYIQSSKLSEAYTTQRRSVDAKVLLKEEVKLRVAKRCGFPYPKSGNFLEVQKFFYAFRDEYSNMVDLLNAANQTAELVQGDKRARQLPRLDNCPQSVGKALREVYGDLQLGNFLPAEAFTLTKPIGDWAVGRKDREAKDAYDREEKIFHKKKPLKEMRNIHFAPSYQSKTLDWFAHNNKLTISSKVSQALAGRLDTEENVYLPHNKDKNGKAQYLSEEQVAWVFLGIATSRTSTASVFNTKVYGSDGGPKSEDHEPTVCERMHELLRLIAANKTDGEYDMRRVQDMVDLFNVSDPETFAHFGMDSVNGFLESEFGQYLIAHNSVNSIKNIRLTMVAKARLDKIYERFDNQKDILENRELHSIEEVRQAIADVASAEERLMSSSWVWETIILDSRMAERHDDSRPFVRWKNGEIKKNLTRYSSGTRSLWQDEKIQEYDTLEQVLLDVTLSKEERCQIIADVVREQVGYEYFNAYEVPHQLEKQVFYSYGANPTYSEGVMTATNDFNELYERTEKFYKKEQEAHQAFKRWLTIAKPGTLLNMMKYWVDHPDQYCRVDLNMAADSMCATLDKTFGQSEKGQQHPFTAYFYKAICNAKNGGLLSQVYHTDDKAIGLQSVDMVSSYDVLKLLTDPTFSVSVYDKEGTVYFIDQGVMLDGYEGNTLDRQLQSFFKDNPNLFTYVLPQQAYDYGLSLDPTAAMRTLFKADDAAWEKADKDSIINEMLIFDESVSVDLLDDPSFEAIAAMITPIKGRTAEQCKPKFRANLLRLQRFLQQQKARYPEDRDAFKNVFSSDDFYAILAKDEYVEGEDSLLRAQADQLEQACNDAIENWFNLVRPSTIGEMIELKPQDISSCHAFYDVRQELSGSKTSTSTGVEGSESHKTAAPMVAAQPEDLYRTVASYEKESLIEHYGDAMTSLGAKIKDLTDEDWAMIDDPNQEVIIDLPPTANKNNRAETNSVCRYLLISRDKDAEAFNLKAKKTGDDGLHSISKYQKYLTKEQLGELECKSSNYEEVLDWLDDLYREAELDDNIDNPMFPVHLALGKRIRQINKFAGHKFVTLDDAVNIAALMCVKDESGNLKLRSISMISQAIKTGLSPQTVKHGKREQIQQEARRIAQQAGNVDYENGREILLNNVSKPHTLGAHISPTPIRGSVEIRFNTLQEMINSLNERKRVEHHAVTKEDDIRTREKAAKGAVLLGAIRSDEVMVGWGNAFPPGQCCGPKGVWVFPEQDPPTMDNLRLAYSQGLQVVIPLDDTVDRFEELGFQIEELSGHRYARINFFNQILKDNSRYATDPAFSIFRRSADNLVTMVETEVAEFGLGDAVLKVAQCLADRLHLNWQDNTQITAERMFPNLMKSNPDATLNMRLATQEDLLDILHPTANTDIDFGVANDGSKDFQKHSEMVMDAIDRYVDKWNQRDGDFYRGGIIEEAEPGDVVGWMACDVSSPDGESFTCYAPIIPWTMFKTNDVSSAEVPAKVAVNAVHFNDDAVPGQSFVNINWTFDDKLTNHAFKFFEGTKAANKMMANMDKLAPTRFIRNWNDSSKSWEDDSQLAIDCYTATESTASRRVGANARLGTMQSLMMLARKKGYNFAEAEHAFPDNPMLNEELSLKDALKEHSLSRKEWEQFGFANGATAKDINVKFHDDVKLDTWIKMELCRFYRNGGNPSDYLCSRFGDEYTDVWWEFECMFGTSLAYQSQLQHFISEMIPGFCPPDVNDTSENYTFRCEPDGEFGPCLLMQVPHENLTDGSMYYVWERVYTNWSFFNFNDFSGKSRPNVNGYSNALDAVTAWLLGGENVPQRKFREFLMSSLSDMAEYKAPRFGFDVEDILESKNEEGDE